MSHITRVESPKPSSSAAIEAEYRVLLADLNATIASISKKRRKLLRAAWQEAKNASILSPFNSHSLEWLNCLVTQQILKDFGHEPNEGFWRNTKKKVKDPKKVTKKAITSGAGLATKITAKGLGGPAGNTASGGGGLAGLPTFIAKLMHLRAFINWSEVIPEVAKNAREAEIWEGKYKQNLGRLTEEDHKVHAKWRENLEDWRKEMLQNYNDSKKRGRAGSRGSVNGDRVSESPPSDFYQPQAGGADPGKQEGLGVLNGKVVGGAPLGHKKKW